ncbi:hypothetical protein [Echinicola vietnamensis]|uniref:Uncharacterized protein n=1 Tax=Echinicola vietnamensis (strain DSM 17526 / LMG 23754 / KMM 6221) TaxID=926556 RepID=L0FV10_ECHVK|nr:hypothetical protein [Echinicola vietnamensis]AGA77137.1 hypothetical protein Echvi_0864 [Echinicola vietnamensis DSM 17526]
MTKYFTPSEQLIQYVYQEMSDEESIAFEQILQKDKCLMQEYLDTLDMLGRLNDMVLEPSEKTIKAILKKSKSSGLEKV